MHTDRTEALDNQLGKTHHAVAKSYQTTDPELGVQDIGLAVGEMYKLLGMLTAQVGDLTRDLARLKAGLGLRD